MYEAYTCRHTCGFLSVYIRCFKFKATRDSMNIYPVHPRISETHVVNYIIMRRRWRRMRRRGRCDNNNPAKRWLADPGRWAMCDSWKEPEPASNFKTRDTNVTHMEFRRSSFYLLQRGRNNDPRIGSNGFVLLTDVKKALISRGLICISTR